MGAMVKQRAEFDCMLACIAMAASSFYDIWPDMILAQCEANKGVYDKDIDPCFSIAGFQKDVDYWRVMVPDVVAHSYFVRGMLKGRRALLQVPSLNYEGGQHMVYWDGHTLHDPSNKQVYRWLDHCVPSWMWIFCEVN